MNLLEKIDSDLKEAMKARHTFEVATLRMLKSALKYAALEKGGAATTLTDEDVLLLLRKQIKQREDSSRSFEQGGRLELAEKEKREIALIRHYLPQELSEEELASLIQEALEEVGATSKAQMGAVMKVAQAKIAGRADGRTVSTILQRLLSSL